MYFACSRLLRRLLRRTVTPSFKQETILRIETIIIVLLFVCKITSAKPQRASAKQNSKHQLKTNQTVASKTALVFTLMMMMMTMKDELTLA